MPHWWQSLPLPTPPLHHNCTYSLNTPHRFWSTLADSGKARGQCTNDVLIHYFITLVCWAVVVFPKNNPAYMRHWISWQKKHQVSHVTCFVWHVTKTNSHSHRQSPQLTPPLCTEGCCCWLWPRPINNEWQGPKKNFSMAIFDHFWATIG